MWVLPRLFGALEVVHWTVSSHETRTRGWRRPAQGGRRPALARGADARSFDVYSLHLTLQHSPHAISKTNSAPNGRVSPRGLLIHTEDLPFNDRRR